MFLLFYKATLMLAPSNQKILLNQTERAVLDILLYSEGVRLYFFLNALENLE